jgi:phospholipase A-2-activating protein
VFVAPDGRIITGSQDKTIRIWGKDYKIEKEWIAHEDIIRKFCDYSPVGFVSCSNDAVLKIWTYDGDLVAELKGHTGFVFTVFSLPNNIIASGSDDKTVRIWKDCSCVQTIEFPATIWDIQSNLLGDIVIASEDYSIYIFTKDPERCANGKELKEYDDKVTESNQTAVEVDPNKFPSIDKMSQFTGKTEGEMKVFNCNGIARVYKWEKANRKWELFGDVSMGPSGPPQEKSKMYEGDRLFEAGEYDHVFDVEIGDGVMRQLPFNNGGNADEAANKF